MHSKRINGASWLMLVAVVVGAVNLGGSAGAETASCGPGTGNYPPTAVNLQLSITHDIPVTGTVTVSGSGFIPGSTVQFTPAGFTPGSATISASGSFSLTVTLPIGTLAGDAEIAATGTGSGGCLRERANFTVSVLGTSLAQALHLVGHSNSVVPGEAVTFSANGCGPVTPVRFFLDTTATPIGQTSSDAQGAFTSAITIPPDTAPGAHNILAVCEDPLTLSLAITVTARPGSRPLPVTGANVRPLLLAVAVLLVVGMLLMLGSRRSRKRRGQS